MSCQNLYPEETMRYDMHVVILCSAKMIHSSERTKESFCSQNNFISILARSAVNNALFLCYSKGCLLSTRSCSISAPPRPCCKHRTKLTTSSGNGGTGQVSGGLPGAPVENHCQISFLSFFTSFPTNLLLSPPLPKLFVYKI